MKAGTSYNIIFTHQAVSALGPAEVRIGFSEVFQQQ